MADKKITLHPLKSDGSIDTTTNLYPKTLATQVEGLDLFIIDQVKNKVDKKTTTGIFAYTHNGDVQGEIAIVKAAVPGTIPIRGNSGNITVDQTPVNENHATSKKYVDELVAGMAASINAENGTGTNAVRQKMANATVNFGDDGSGNPRNANAIALDPTLSAVINTGASGNQSAAFGKDTMALATASFTNGNKTVAKGEESHAEGYQSVTLADGSHAEGERTTAASSVSHSEGSDTIANANASHAEGVRSQTKSFTEGGANGSHAEGESTLASGYASHTEGYGSYTGAIENAPTYPEIPDVPGGGGSGGGGEVTQVGNAAHAEGNYCRAIGTGSHAEGYRTTTLHEASHTEGVGTKSSNNGQSVMGSYNADNSDAIVIVGKGTDDEHRSNAFEVLADGRATIGHDPINNMDVATKGYVDTAVSSAVGMRLFEHKIQCEVYDIQNTRFVFNLTVINTSAAPITGTHNLTELYYGMGIKQTILSQYDAVLYVLADTGQGVDEMKIAELEENGTYSFHTGAIDYQAQFTVIGTDTITQI